MTLAEKVQPNVTTRALNKFWWIDLATSDLAAAKSFYGPLLQWDFTDTDMGNGMVYSTILRGGCEVAGAMEMSQEMKQSGMPPHWGGFILVKDAAAIEKRAAELGATVMSPTMDVDSPDGLKIGKMTILQDPTGATFGLWQAGEHEGANLVNAPGALSWTELLTRDVQKAREFYTKLFGWTATKQDMPGMDYWTFEIDGEMHCGLMQIRDDMPADMPPYWNVIVGVENTDKALEYTTSHGGKVTFGPMDSPYGRIGGIVDPQGANLTIMQPPAGGFTS